MRENQTHPSFERFPVGVSIAHVSKYPENDNTGLESVHSSLRRTAGGLRGEKSGGQSEARGKIKQREEEGNIEPKRSGTGAIMHREQPALPNNSTFLMMGIYLLKGHELQMIQNIF